MQDRELKLADIKKRSDEYRAQKSAPAAAPQAGPKPTGTVKTGSFNF